MATDVLGAGVSDDVSTEVERVLVDRGHESVVNDEESTVRLGALGEGLNIEYLKGRVSGSLEPDHSCVGTQLFLELVDIAEILESDLNVGVRSKDGTKVSLGTAIDVIDNEDVVSLLAKVHEGDVSGHTRAGGESVVGVLKGSKLSLESESGGVTATSVIEDDGLTGGGLGEGRREVEGNADTTELLAGFGTAVDNSG